MKFATITPIEFINESKFHVCQDYHLMLAHLAHSDKEYCERFKKVEGTKILDNGYFERIIPFNIFKLVKIGKDLKATHVVVPETFYTQPEEDYYMQMIESYCKIIKNEGLKSSVTLTGNTINSTLRNFQLLLNSELVDMICIPDRLLSQRIKISRLRLLQLIKEKFTNSNNPFLNKEIHLFALDDYTNLSKISKYKFVTGIDSTLPFKTGYFKIALNGNKLDIPRPQNYFNLKAIDSDNEKIILNNIIYFRRWFE